MHAQKIFLLFFFLHSKQIYILQRVSSLTYTIPIPAHH